MTKSKSDVQTTYDRIAPLYDIWDAIPEGLLYRSWRRQLWNRLTAGKILEIGVGTGKNIRFYPPGGQVTAIDISPKMLEKAAAKASARQDVSVELLTMDVSELAFADGIFDAVVGSFILTVLTDPLKALREIKRVCKPGGKLLLLEFTRSDNKLVALLQDLVTPLTDAIYKAHLNRDPVTLVQRGGYQITTAEAVGNSMVTLIQAVLPDRD